MASDPMTDTQPSAAALEKAREVLERIKKDCEPCEFFDPSYAGEEQENVIAVALDAAVKATQERIIVLLSGPGGAEGVGYWTEEIEADYWDLDVPKIAAAIRALTTEEVLNGK